MTGNNLFTMINEAQKNSSTDIFSFIQKYGKKCKYKPGDIIIKERAIAKEIFIILSGETDVIKNDEFGNKIKLTTLGKGAIIGEMAAFLGKKRSADVVAKTEVAMLHFSIESFLTALTSVPSLLLRLLNSFSGKIDNLNKQTTELLESNNTLKIGYLLATQRTDFSQPKANISLNITETIDKLKINKNLFKIAINSLYESGAISNVFYNDTGAVSFQLDYDKLSSILR